MVASVGATCNASRKPKESRIATPIALSVNVARFIYAQFTPAKGGKGSVRHSTATSGGVVDEVDLVDKVD